MIISIVVLILIISGLVLVHELGHFFAAKKSGVRVEEFGMGLPPRIWGKRLGETLFSLNLLPFGGFVKLTGEDSTEQLEKPLDDKSFANKSPFKRLFILIAGVSMNFILAIVLYNIFFAFNGYKSFAMPLFFDYDFRFGQEKLIGTVISGLEQGGPSDLAKLKVGEAVIEIGGTPVYSLADIRKELSEKANQKVSVLVMDITSMTTPIRSVDVVAKKDSNGFGKLGIYLSKAVVLDYSKKPALSGISHAYNMLSYSSYTLKKLILLSFEQKDASIVSNSVAGPVGIFNLIQGIMAYSGIEVLFRLVDLIALLSLSLGFINIMPFPALDGGRVIFVLYEIIFRKPLNPVLESNIHKYGMIVLLGLLLLVTFKDITTIFR